MLDVCLATGYWSILVRNRLFKTAPDIDKPPFQFIHIVDLSVVDTMLHDSRLDARKFGVSWRNSSTVAPARRGVPVNCPAGTKLLPDTPHIAGSSITSLWCREAASKKSVRDITRISYFVTTMKYRMQCRFIQQFCEEVYAVAVFKVVQQQVKWKIQLYMCEQIIVLFYQELLKLLNLKSVNYIFSDYCVNYI